MTLSEQVFVALKKRGWMMVTAESCTGGLISAAMTEVAGSSAVFDRGFVTYSNGAKMDMLGVPEALLVDHGAVSEQVASAMASGALKASKGQIAVSVTGIAGPGGSDHKPEGRVCFGVSVAGEVTVETVEFSAIGRENVRRATVEHALTLVLRQVSQ